MDQNINHLLLRAGFGTNPKEVNDKGWDSVEAVLEDLFKTKRVNIQADGAASADVTKVDKSRIKSQTVKLNLAWINEMATTDAVLQEKMTLFWHDHFGVKARLPQLGAQHVNTLRKHALGKFGDLLHAVAKDPAMLLFLNTQQNKKTAPNENFARELFELFTLGEGNYTEKDIKEAARAFTGWKMDRTGKFRFVRFQHDYGSKQIFDRRGNFEGEEVIDMVLKRPETARFICDKIIDFMVGEAVNEEIRVELAQKYSNWDLHTGKLLKEIFTSDWFYHPSVIGARIKTPIELLVGIMRSFQVKDNAGLGVLLAQRSMGQVLYSPPSVAGWPTGRNWIDSSSLLYRQNLGFAVLLRKELKGINKKNFDAMLKDLDLKSNSVDFSASTAFWDHLSLEHCSSYLLSKKPEEAMIHNIDRISASEDDSQKLRLAMLMGIPEFQLC